MSTSFRWTHLEPDFREQPKTDHFCFLCQRDIKPSSKYRMIHVIAGGGRVLHPEDEHLYNSEDPGDMLWHPIGPDCAKKLGLEWSVEA